MADEVASELERLAEVDPVLFGGAGTKLCPKKLAVVAQFQQVPVRAGVLKWSQGDSNPCYRRERPAS